MPNWKTHIEIAKRLNNYLKYNEEQLNIFMLGSILPDINNGYIVSGVSKKITYDITHMGNFINTSYIDFFNKYKNEIEKANPLFMGYLVHLYTDYTWNKNFQIKVNKLNIHRENRHELREMKQSDFKVYNNRFVENFIEIRDIDTVLNEIEKVNEVSITRQDLLKVIEFLHVKKLYEAEMHFYSIKELDELMNDTIKEYKAFQRLQLDGEQSTKLTER